MRALLVAASLGLAAAAVVLTLWPPAQPEPRFAAAECRRLALVDAASGAALVGIEDIAAHGDALYLSAQDRAAAEAATAAGLPAPEGGLYRLALADLDAPGPILLARQPPGPGGPFHPHGIDADGDRLAAIGRAYGPEGAAGVEVRLFAIGPEGLRPAGRIADPGLCAANDLLIDGARLLVTLDREGCPGLSLAEAAFGGATGRLAALEVGEGARLAPGIDRFSFANGLALYGPDGRVRLAVAETRGRRIALVDPAGATADHERLPMPGGPDNLTAAPDGRIVAALHPLLLRLALYRHGWLGRAPSRAVAVNPGEGRFEMLYDDPTGAQFSGATVAVLTGGPAPRLVLGSVRDAGVLVCGGVP